MSKLKDILNKKHIEPQVVSEEIIKPKTTIHNKTWLNNISDRYGYIPNTDNNKVDGILLALDRRNGFCPCGGNGIQFICPCHIMKENGICKCGLFQNITPIKPLGNSSAIIKQEDN